MTALTLGRAMLRSLVLCGMILSTSKVCRKGKLTCHLGFRSNLNTEQLSELVVTLAQASSGMQGRLASLARGKIASGCVGLQGWASGKPDLKPGQVAGLIDGEGCLTINKKPDRTSYNPVFCLEMNIKEWPLLEAVREFFDGHGSVHVNKQRHTCRLSIADKAGLRKVVNLLQQQPLLTTKYHDALRWSSCVQLYCAGDHLGQPGTEEMQAHKASMNTNRPRGTLCGLASHGSVGDHFADWLSGFASGEASFHLCRASLRPGFSIAQHSDSVVVLKYIAGHIGLCPGHVRTYGNDSLLQVSGAQELVTVLEHFSANPPFGSKLHDFQTWSKAVDAFHSAREEHGRQWRQHITYESIAHDCRHSWNRGARVPAYMRQWRDRRGKRAHSGRTLPDAMAAKAVRRSHNERDFEYVIHLLMGFGKLWCTSTTIDPSPMITYRWFGNHLANSEAKSVLEAWAFPVMGSGHLSCFGSVLLLTSRQINCVGLAGDKLRQDRSSVGKGSINGVAVGVGERVGVRQSGCCCWPAPVGLAR
eukprot:86719-Amphidinium_carterae.1